MATHPYLHFNGTCAEAMAFYGDVFGGTELQLARYADMPEGPPDWRRTDRVMHAQIRIGDGTLMGSDAPPGQDGPPQQSVSVMQTSPDAATGKLWFERLAAGGAVIQPYQKTAFSEGFGMATDKFGTHWILAV